MAIRASPARSGRVTGTATPVEVSLWAQPTRSTPSYCSAPMVAMLGAVPGSVETTIGSSRNGAFFATVANLLENSP